MGQSGSNSNDHRNTGNNASGNETNISSHHSTLPRQHQTQSYYHQTHAPNQITTVQSSTLNIQPTMPKSNTYSNKTSSEHSHYSSNKTYHNNNKNDDRSSSNVPQHYNASNYSYTQHHYYNHHHQQQLSHQYENNEQLPNKGGDQDHDDITSTNSTQTYSGRQSKEPWATRNKGRRRRDENEHPRSSYNYNANQQGGNGGTSNSGGYIANSYQHSKPQQSFLNTSQNVISNNVGSSNRERGNSNIDRMDRRDRNTTEHHVSGHNSRTIHDNEKVAPFNNGTESSKHGYARTESSSNTKDTLVQNLRPTHFDLKQAAFPPLPGSDSNDSIGIVAGKNANSLSSSGKAAASNQHTESQSKATKIDSNHDSSGQTPAVPQSATWIGENRLADVVKGTVGKQQLNAGNKTKTDKDVRSEVSPVTLDDESTIDQSNTELSLNSNLSKYHSVFK